MRIVLKYSCVSRTLLLLCGRDKTYEEVQADREAFDAAFKRDVASQLSVAETAVTVLSVVSGSVIVSFRVDNPPEDTAQLLAAPAATIAGASVENVVTTSYFGLDVEPELEPAASNNLETSSTPTLQSGQPGPAATAGADSTQLQQMFVLISGLVTAVFWQF
eukprot:SAG31_NODE_5318_length_2613_cov_1.905330_5_plen_162_part_00